MAESSPKISLVVATSKDQLQTISNMITYLLNNNIQRYVIGKDYCKVWLVDGGRIDVVLEDVGHSCGGRCHNLFYFGDTNSRTFAEVFLPRVCK